MKLTGCLDENVFFPRCWSRCVPGDVSVKAKERESEIKTTFWKVAMIIVAAGH